MTDADFMLARVVEDSRGCWVWKYYKDSDGYGRTKRGGKTISTHRLAYIAFIGEIPKGHDVDHSCWNPSCCNPDHLRVLPAVVNRSRQRSSMAKKCIHGHLLEGENLAVSKNGRRYCRACNRWRTKEYLRRKKEAAA